MRDLYWAAGFLEGEGAFGNQRTNVALTAQQVQREPLERLYRILGGRLATFKAPHCSGGIVHRWSSVGTRAAGLAMTLFPLMSPRRQEQIEQALAKWKAAGPSRAVVNRMKTHCPKGHEYTEANTYRNPRNGRQCIACRGRFKKAGFRQTGVASGSGLSATE